MSGNTLDLVVIIAANGNGSTSDSLSLSCSVHHRYIRAVVKMPMTLAGGNGWAAALFLSGKG